MVEQTNHAKSGGKIIVNSLNENASLSSTNAAVHNHQAAGTTASSQGVIRGHPSYLYAKSSNPLSSNPSSKPSAVSGSLQRLSGHVGQSFDSKTDTNILDSARGGI